MQTENASGISAAGGAVSRTVDNANTSVHHAIDRASGAAGPAIDRLAAGAHQAADRVALTANEAAEALKSAGGQIRNAQNQVVQSCSNYVREKPMTAVSIAVASGFILGLLVRLR